MFLWLCASILTLGAEPVRMFPAGAPPAATVDVVDMRGATLDEKLVATTLQGLVNRGPEAPVYLLLAQWDVFWQEYLQSKQWVKHFRPRSFREYVAAYGNRAAQVVFYDPEVPATINVATMLASVEGGVAAHPGQADLFGDAIPRVDLRGRWTTNAEAYRWAFETLWPRMNPRVLACYHPTSCAHHLRDYLVAHRIFHLWVTGEEKPGDAVSNHEAERDVLEEVLKAAPVNVPVLGFWYSGADKGMDEYRGVGLAGEYGKLTVVCDWATNLSLLCGVPVDLAGAIAAYRTRELPSAPSLDAGKIYVCFDIVESGDAPSYLQGRQHEVWQDAKRGTVAVNWSMGPGIFELAPPVAAYYFEKASVNDYIYMAISGAAYVHPFRDFMGRVEDGDGAWNGYVGMTRAYLRQMQCGEVGLYTDAWRPYKRAAAEPVMNRFLNGIPEATQIILGMGRDEGMAPSRASYEMGERRVLVSHILTRWPTDYARRSREENVAWLADDIRAQTPAERPAFMQVMALSWAYGAGEIAEVCSRLGGEYVAVRLPEYLKLFREAGGGR